MSQAAMHPADKCLGETKNSCRYTGRIHQVSGKDKKCYRDQWETINSTDHAVEYNNTWGALHQYEDKGSDTQGHRYRRADNQ